MVCGIVIIIVGLYYTRRYHEFEKAVFEIESLPVLDTNEAVAGLPYNGYGTVKTDKTLIAPFSQTPCVYFHSVVEEFVKSGRSNKWEIRQNNCAFVPFWIEDGRGKLLIDIENVDSDFSNYPISENVDAGGTRLVLNFSRIKFSHIPEATQYSEIRAIPVMEKEEYLAEGLFAIRYRRSEFVIQSGINVFVHGQVSKVDGVLKLQESEKHPLIISNKTKVDYVKEFYRGSSIIYLVHILVLIGFVTFVLSLNYFLMTDSFVLNIFIGFSVMAILGTLIFTTYNRVITLKQRALNALSNIHVELKRRSDLIPSLEKVVKGYAKHEQEILAAITAIRAHVKLTDKLEMVKGDRYADLVALIEKYPDLKAQENFTKFFVALADTEERIAYSRSFYNTSVGKYNSMIQQFPFSILAEVLGLKSMQFVSFKD
jgi:LemA protein